MGELMKLEEVQSLSKVFVESKLFKDVADIAKASVKIIAGASLGLEAFQSMQGIDIIQGKLVINASTQASMVKKSGKYDYKIIEHTNEICKLEFLEKRDGKFEKIGDSSFSLDDARLAGLAAKDNWIKYPKNMLFARAFSNGVKWCCPDVFGGAVYNESDSFQQEPEPKFKAEVLEEKPDHVAKHFEIEEEPSGVFLALKKTIETEAFTLLSLDVFAQEIAANKDLLSSNELAELRAIFRETKTNLNKIEQGEITL
jgi:hypothetical protein